MVSPPPFFFIFGRRPTDPPQTHPASFALKKTMHIFSFFSRLYKRRGGCLGLSHVTQGMFAQREGGGTSLPLPDTPHEHSCKKITIHIFSHCCAYSIYFGTSRKRHPPSPPLMPSRHIPFTPNPAAPTCWASPQKKNTKSRTNMLPLHRISSQLPKYRFR